MRLARARSVARGVGVAVALASGLALAACSDGGSGAREVGTVRESLLTGGATMMGWIEQIVAQGIRAAGVSRVQEARW